MKTTALTFGRFNIPHAGHVNLVARMLSEAETARVYISEGRNNTSWVKRKASFRHLCFAQGIDTTRVSFLKAPSPFQAIKETLSSHGHQDVTLILGSDQVEMGLSLSDKFQVEFKEHTRITSSTEVRRLIDGGFQTELLTAYGNNRHAVRLAKLLRQEELTHEKPRKTQIATQRVIAKVPRSQGGVSVAVG